MPSAIIHRARQESLALSVEAKDNSFKISNLQRMDKVIGSVSDGSTNSARRKLLVVKKLQLFHRQPAPRCLGFFIRRSARARQILRSYFLDVEPGSAIAHGADDLFERRRFTSDPT